MHCSIASKLEEEGFIFSLGGSESGEKKPFGNLARCTLPFDVTCMGIQLSCRAAPTATKSKVFSRREISWLGEFLEPTPPLSVGRLAERRGKKTLFFHFQFIAVTCFEQILRLEIALLQTSFAATAPIRKRLWLRGILPIHNLSPFPVHAPC